VEPCAKATPPVTAQLAFALDLGKAAGLPGDMSAGILRAQMMLGYRGLTE
jgi:hypothetical protein